MNPLFSFPFLFNNNNAHICSIKGGVLLQSVFSSRWMKWTIHQENICSPLSWVQWSEKNSSWWSCVMVCLLLFACFFANDKADKCHQWVILLKRENVNYLPNHLFFFFNFAIIRSVSDHFIILSREPCRGWWVHLSLPEIQAQASALGSQCSSPRWE